MAGPLQVIMETKVLAILRGLTPEQVLPMAGALAEGGIRALEVTLDSPAALESIQLLRHLGGPGLTVGAGTVLDGAAAARAIGVGAQVIVTPGVLPDVAAVCREERIPLLMGASTPSEVLAAHRSGSQLVKFFPASSLGIEFLKAMRAPLAHVPIMATGGIHAGNARAFLDAGASAVGVGGSLTSGAAVDEGDWPTVTARARELLAAIRRA